MSRFLYVYAALTVVASFLASATGCPSLFSLPPDETKLWGSLLLALFLSAAVIQGGKLLERQAWYRGMAATLKRMLTAPELLGPDLDSSKAFVIAAYSSVGEEAFFRGFVQPWLIGKWALWAGAEGVGVSLLGIFSASLIFGILHFPAERELRPWSLFAVVVGFLLGCLAAWSGSLLAPVAAHLLINWRNLKRLAEVELEPLPESDLEEA